MKKVDKNIRNVCNMCNALELMMTSLWKLRSTKEAEMHFI
jgi:hypothetical protein